MSPSAIPHADENADRSGLVSRYRLADPQFRQIQPAGLRGMATALMKRTFRQKGVASIEELRESAVEAGVKFYACQMTVDAFGFEKPDFIPPPKPQNPKTPKPPHLQ